MYSTINNNSWNKLPTYTKYKFRISYGKALITRIWKMKNLRKRKTARNTKSYTYKKRSQRKLANCMD